MNNTKENFDLAPFQFDTPLEKERYDNFKNKHLQQCNNNYFPIINMYKRGKTYYYELWCQVCGEVQCITDLTKEVFNGDIK